MGDEDDKSKIYVGSLNFDTDKDGLRNYFEKQVGEQTVSDAIVIKDKETGRSRGFGFVTFVDSSWVDKALSLNDTELDGRTIKVHKANPRGSGGGGGRGGGGFRGGRGGGYGGGGYGGGGYGGGGYGYGGSGGSFGGRQNYDRWGGGGGAYGGGNYQQNTGGAYGGGWGGYQ